MDEWLTLYPAFLLIFIRVSSFFVVLPLFNHRTVPAPLKLGLSAFLAAILAVSLDVPELALDL
ncbi:flagellar biosynthetic protein FliR, partial [Shouchella clausii]